MDGQPATAGLLAAVEEWTKLLLRAEVRRLDVDHFATFARITSTKYPLPPQLIADLLLRPTASSRESAGPRVPQYLDALLKQKAVNTVSVLSALYKYSTAHARIESDTERQDAIDTAHGVIKAEPGVSAVPPKKPKITRWRNSYRSEAIILWQLARYVRQGTGVQSGRDVVEIAKVMVRWISLINDATAAFSRDAFNGIDTQQQKNDFGSSRDAFILFIIAFIEHNIVLTTLEKPIAKPVRKHLSESFEAFIPSVMHVSPDFASRLDMFRTQHLVIYDSADKKEAAVSEMNSYMDSLMGLDNFQVSEIPILNTRAGLYIYLSAALAGRPLVDDVALFTYLHNRYQGDIHTTAVQFILASFDVLANAVFRNEGSKDGHLLKSFVVNKVPLILVSLSLAPSSSMYPFNPELCITEALGQVDTNVFPTLSGMFDMSSNNSSSFQDSVRQDFCFACQLHGLLSQRAIENLLGEITYQSLPDEGRYERSILIQACLVDPERTQKLIGELDLMNGNVGAAAQAVVEVISSLCRNKETMTLKQLCSQLACKPSSLDILLLFNPAHKLLHPLAELLDDWGGYDDDQGEYQPVYEEFGSILLLMLALVYRYNLSTYDLGIRSPDSFIAKFLSTGSVARPLDELSAQEKAHLHGWILGLFGDSTGLGDELMASCPPQDFYLLMPTLFNHIVIALCTGYLSDETLRSGLEYLLDVFLLPSLVPAMLYLSNQLWAESRQGQLAIIKILQFILRSQSSSNEATAMFGSVLNIVAKPLEHALRSYQRQDPKSQEVEPLLRAFKDNLAVSRRTGGVDHKELESWTSWTSTPSNGSTSHPAGIVVGNLPHNMPGSIANSNVPPPSGGLSAFMRHSIQSLVNWAQQPGMATTYIHRQTLVAIKMLGANQLLKVLLAELKSLTDSGQGSVAYDVVTAIICAPDVTNDVSSTNPGLPPVVDDAGGAFGAPALQPPVPPQRRMTLREALKYEAEDWKLIQKGSDPGMAEIVVRLYRRVEAQMALPPPSAMGILGAAGDLGGLGVGVGGIGGAALMGDAAMAAAVVGDTSGAVGGVVDGGLTLDTTGLDGTSGVDLGGMGSAVGDLGGLGSATGSVVGGGAGGAGGAGSLDLDAENIFSGLPSLTGADFDTNSFPGWDMEAY